ncbi:hypothetical protein [Caulobacter sp. DWP3-1-3b2]|uniref:hypothetical protein n=1 Tax=Caulobacter sp. DWP3-1-3b2 TaxID=2804643 RepID=UPI003CF8BB59
MTLTAPAAQAAAKRLSRVAAGFSLDDGKIVVTSPTDSDAERRETVDRLLLVVAP